MSAVMLQNVTFQTAGTTILEGVDWKVEEGTVAAILGPNGSGKSTLLRMITGYLFPTAGTVSVLGQQLGSVDLHQLRRQIGVVDPGSPYLPEARLSVLETVLTGFFGNLCIDFDRPTDAQVAIARKTLEDVGLSGHEQQRFQTLSTGEGRRTLLARALVHKPDLLILDEPTAGLDLRGRETMLATIDRLLERVPSLTLLTVTHHLEELSPRTTEVLLLSGGKKVRAGSPAEVLSDQSLSETFGCPVRVRQDHGRWQWSVDPTVWGTLVSSL